MTSSRFLLARIAKILGYARRAQRLSEAASEMHLLREAEAHLGEAIWHNVETIEALSVEYWNLRKLTKEKDQVQARLVACQTKLKLAHEQRANLLNSTPEIHPELINERAALLAELEQLANTRDQIVGEAREVRRTYVGLKMKLEVLTKEAHESHSNQAAINKVRTRLVELKTRFAELKQERIRIGEAIEAGDLKVDGVDNELKDKRQNRRVHASEAFHIIGEGNRELSIINAASGLLDTRMRLLYAEIGRYVSLYAPRSAACAAAVANHRGLVEVMHALRHSIMLNYRLAD